MVRRVLLSISLAFAALLAAIGLVCITPRPNPPKFALLHSWPPEKLSLRDRIDRLIPHQRSWAWAWHTEEFLFRKRRIVNISARVLSFGGPTAQKCVTDIGPPTFSLTDQMDVWLLSTNQMQQFEKAVGRNAGSRFLNHTQVSTADGVQARIFCGDSRGTNPVISSGLQMDFLAHDRAACADLIVGALYSEFQTNIASRSASSDVSVRTNLDTLFRIQLPSGKGLLMITADKAANRFGVMLDPLRR